MINVINFAYFFLLFNKAVGKFQIMYVACIIFLLDNAGIEYDMEKAEKENLSCDSLKICKSLITACYTEFHFPEDGYFWCYINTGLKARVAWA